MSRDQAAPTRSRTRAYFGLAALAAPLAVVLGLVRSRRTGVEVALVAVVLGLYGLRDLGVGSRRVLTLAAWVALLAVAAIGLEPHVH